MDHIELSASRLSEDQADVYQVRIRINGVPLEDWVARGEFAYRYPRTSEIERARAARFQFPEWMERAYHGVTPFEFIKDYPTSWNEFHVLELLEGPWRAGKPGFSSVRAFRRRTGSIVEWGRFFRMMPSQKRTESYATWELTDIGPFTFSAEAYAQALHALDDFRIPVRRTPPTVNLLPPRPPDGWDAVRFVFEEDEFEGRSFSVAHIYVNGRSFRDWIDLCEYPLDGDPAPEECERIRREGLPPEFTSYAHMRPEWLFPGLSRSIPHSGAWKEHVLHYGFPPEEEEATVLCCMCCRETGCWPLQLKTRVTEDAVEWYDFVQPHRNAEKDFWRYEHLGTLRFHKDAYMEEMARLEAFVQLQRPRRA